MPAVALVGAYASISAGIAAGAATFLGGLQIAAGVMTGLGALTGNKKLMTIGAIASLGTGAYSAMSGGSAASTASGLESVGGEGVAMGTAAGNAGSNAVEMGFADLAGGSDLGAVASGVSGGDVAASTLGPAGDSIYSLASAPAAQQPGGLVQQAMNPQTQQPGGLVSNATRSGTSGTGGGLAQKELPKGTGFFDGVLDKLSSGAEYLKANPEVAKLGLGLVSGATDAYSEQEQLKFRARLLAEQRARYNASILNQRA